MEAKPVSSKAWQTGTSCKWRKMERSSTNIARWKSKGRLESSRLRSLKKQVESSEEAEKQFQCYVDGFQPEFCELKNCPSTFQAVQPPKTLAICDGVLETDPAVPVPVDPKQLSKIDDALSWISQAKAATFKLKVAKNSSTFQHLKGQLDSKWESLLPLQLQLEQIKLTGQSCSHEFQKPHGERGE